MRNNDARSMIHKGGFLSFLAFVFLATTIIPDGLQASDQVWRDESNREELLREQVVRLANYSYVREIFKNGPNPETLALARGKDSFLLHQPSGQVRQGLTHTRVEPVATISQPPGYSSAFISTRSAAHIAVVGSLITIAIITARSLR